MLYYRIPFNQVGIEFDEKNMPTGIFRKNANDMLRANILNDTDDFFRLDALKQLMPILAEQGLQQLTQWKAAGYIQIGTQSLSMIR